MHFVRNFLLLCILATSARSALAQCQGIVFERVIQSVTNGSAYTTVAIGPDGRLYATTLDGLIRRWNILPDGTLTGTETLNSLVTAEGGSRLLIGMVFDPSGSAESPIAWVTHTTFGLNGMAEWGAKVSRLSGPQLEVVEDYLLDLPRSSKDHVTNGIVFGPDGALYFLQGSNTATGAPDSAWAHRPERLLTSAVLRFDPDLVASPPLNVRTSPGGSYDPYASGAPLTFYATGVRNAYDLVWHSNGELYVPTNGSAAGGNTPAGTVGAACADGTTYGGPAVVGLTNVGVQRDYLYRIEPDGYYGHPNPLRCEFVLNGGNPTAGADPGEVAQYPVGVAPDANFRGFAYDFGLHSSPNGVIEYQSSLFSGRLRGRLLVARYSQPNDILVLTPGGSPPDIVSTCFGIPGFTGLSSPLDVCEDPATGNLYVSEFGSNRISLLRAKDCPGDVTGDRSVDIDDLLAILEGFGATGGAASNCDADGDGDCDLNDLLRVLIEFGAEC